MLNVIRKMVMGISGGTFSSTCSLIRSTSSTAPSLFFQRQAFTKVFRRGLQTTACPYPNPARNTQVGPITHYKITAEASDTAATITEGLTRVIRPDSVVVYDQPCKLMIQNENGIGYQLMDEKDLRYKEFKAILDAGKDTPGKFALSVGHTFFGITDEHGNIVAGFGFNRSGAQNIERLPGRTHLAPEVFHQNQMNTTIGEGQILTCKEEIDILAKKMLVSKSITAGITVMRLNPAQKDMLLQNIDQVFSQQMLAVYSLCTTWVKEHDIEQLKSTELRQEINKLIKEAKKIPGLEHIQEKDQEMLVCSLACTNALSAVFFGDPHELARQYGPDLSTSVAAALCVAKLAGKDFFKFAATLMAPSNTITAPTLLKSS